MAELPASSGWSVETGLRVGRVQIRSARDVPRRLEAALGFAPPDRPNRVTARAELACASIGPEEWFLTGSAEAIEDALARVCQGFADDLCLATDISAGCLVSTFAGLAAVAFLARYSPLDIGPAHFPTGSATRTRLGDVVLYLARLDDRPTFRMIVDQSMSEYVRHLVSLDRRQP